MAQSVLNSPVLVLNKVWHPVRFVNVIRAVKAASRGRAMMLDHKSYTPYEWDDWIELPIVGEEAFIPTTSGKIRAPKLLLLTAYDRVPSGRVKLCRRNVYIRDGGRCQYTGEKLSEKEATIDHVKPRALGGENDWNNVVLCSRQVNGKKADRTVEQAGLKLSKQPAEPTWSALYAGKYAHVMDPAWESFLSHILKDSK